MPDLKQLSMSELLEKLVNQTLLHKQITLNGGTVGEVIESKTVLRQLQDEIELRKNNKNDSVEIKA